MRDDTITICGPLEVPDLDVVDYTDEDGTLIPAHTVDMSDMRRMIFESRSCPCGVIHGYTVVTRWDLVLGWPEFAEHLVDAGISALTRSMEDCQAVQAIAREMGR